jgi:large subunit ribosomal protein L2
MLVVEYIQEVFLLEKPTKIKINIGFSLPLSYISLFSLINNVELIAFSGGQLLRAAGANALIILKQSNFVSIKLKSG